MASINLDNEQTIKVNMSSESALNTNIKDLNYIPAYKEYEEERQSNELQRIDNEDTRISNEEIRINYYEDIQRKVNEGDFNGKDGKDGKDGENGKNTVYVGSEPPTDDFYNVWINENGEQSTIPTKTSDLTNDSGFITNSVNNLTNYYDKATSDSKYIEAETDPIFSASASAGISSNDITNWNNKAETSDIPTKTSDLTNDSNFVNTNDLATKQDVLVSGINIKTINNNSLLGSGNMDLNLSTGDTFPIGAFMPFGGGNVPANWLLCDGSAVSRTTYEDLFSVIGTSFGEGDGTTTFNLPDYRDRVPVGVNAEGNNFKTIGSKYGEETHTLTNAEMPRHQHNLLNNNTGGTAASYSSNGVGATTNVGFSGNVRTDFSGGAQEHNNIQPSLAANFIIKAFQSAGIVANVAKTKTTSDNDTYSCNYINEITTREEVLYNEVIKSNTSIDLNTNGYKRLLVTCALYDYTNVNTGGVSNVVIVDLESTGNNVTDYIATNSYAYVSSNGTAANSIMQVAININSQKTTFKPVFYYNGNAIASTEDKYYVSKIIGIK